MKRSALWTVLLGSALTAGIAIQAMAQDPAPPAAGGGAPAAGGGGGGGGATGGPTGGAPGGGFPGGGGTPGSTGTPGRNTPSPFPDQQNQQRSPFPNEMERPVYFSGKVVLEDGTPPPESVVIERVCNGNPRPEAYTDSKGRFSFQMGQNSHMMADASVSNSADDIGGRIGGANRNAGFGGAGRGISERDLMGCELRASLPGYRSEAVNLSGRRFMDNPDVGTIILKRMANVEGLTFSATSAMAPKEAKKAYEKAMDLRKKKKLAESQKELEKAVQIYPKFANAWTELGALHEAANRSDDARKAYEQALAADSKLVKPYVSMAMMWARESKWKETEEASSKALKLNPFDYPVAYFYNSVAHFNLQNLDAAEKSAREGIKADTQRRIPKMHHVLGIILAQKNDVPGAMEHMKGYLGMLPKDSPDVKLVQGQISQLEKMAGNQSKQAAQQ